MRVFLIAIATLLLVASQVSATQKFRIKQDGLVRMQAATKGITRIHVEGDRIRQIIYDNENSGFELSNDEETGDVFMRYVGETGSSKRESGYLITEKGLTVGLDISFVNRRTETILITIASSTKSPTSTTQKASRSFVGASGNGGLSDDVTSGLTKFARVAILKLVRSAPPKRRNNSLVSSHVGPDLVGELRIAFAGKSARNVRPQEFYRANVLAVWVERESLAPGERSWVLVIREK